MRPAPSTLLLLGLGLLASACATVQVNVDYDLDADFSRYRTFALLPDPPQTGDTRADSPLLHRRIREAIADQLKSQALTPAETPQLHVAYYTSVEQKFHVYTRDTGYRHWRHGGNVGTTTEVREYEQGTLVIDLIDTAKETLVWRGTAKLRVREQPTPEQVETRVREVVAEILTRFPPTDG